MKLIIAFTEKLDFQIPNKEFAIVSKFKKHLSLPGSKHFLIEDVYLDDSNFLEEEERKYQEYIALLPEELKNIFVASKTTLYFVMMAFKTWQKTIDQVLASHQIEEIIFSDLLVQKFYLPFYEAESEVTKPLFYHSYDFLSISLFDHIKQYHIGYEVSIVNKHSKIKLVKRILFRRYLLLLLKFLIPFAQLFKRLSNTKNFIPKGKRYLFLSRGVAHSQYLLDFAKHYSADVMIYASDGLRTLGKNKSFLTNGNLSPNNYVDNKEISSIRSLIKSFFHVLRLLVLYKFRFENKLKKLDSKFGFSYSSAINEMIIHYLETDIYVRDLDKFVLEMSKNGCKPDVLVSCEIYTQYSFFISLLGKKRGIKTLQLISVAMNIVPLPRYFFCDKAVFNQKYIYKEFEIKNPSLKEVATYWGNLTFNENEQLTRWGSFGDRLKVIYFSQPVIDEENDFVILDTLLRIKKIMPLDIIIKQHPRESVDKFSRYGSDVTIYYATISLKEAISTSDVAIVKFSAVEHYLLNYGIPTIYCAFSEIAKLSMPGVIKTGYAGIAYTSSELENMILNIEELPKFYNKFRIEELNQRFENKGIRAFHESLSNYINE